MKKIGIIVVCIVVMFIFTGCTKEKEAEVNKESEKIMARVLFIGTSHTYFNDMVKTFRDFGDKDKIEIDVTMIASGAKPLIDHYDDLNVKFNILYGNYDYIVLQNAAHPFWKWELDDGLNRMSEYISSTKSKTILFMTWAEKHLPEDYEEIVDGFNEVSERMGYTLAPVGIYFKEFLDDYPGSDVYAPDLSHASEFGSYVAARVIYETVFPNVPKLSYEEIIKLFNN